MTTLLGRYIARTVIAGSVLVLAVLLSLNTLFAITREFGSTGQGDYGVAEALLYVLLTVPADIYELFPAAVAIGGVVGLGALAANSELLVMRAAGVSNGRIVGMVMQGGLVLMAAIVLVGEVVAPPSQQYAERMRSSAIAGQSDVRGPDGLWLRDENRFVNVGEILPGYVLRDVSVYEFEDRRLRRTLHADRAHYERRRDRWRLIDVRSTRLNEERVATQRDAEVTWPRLVPPDLFEVLTVSPETLPGWRLFSYVDYLSDNDLESARFALAFWKKIATPLSTLVMLLLALPMVFGSVRSTGAGQRVFIGSVIGVGYLLLAELFAHVGIVYGLPAPLAVMAPAILFTITGLLLLRRMH
jgi:lipopolysaccharide export system permease protein